MGSKSTLIDTHNRFKDAAEELILEQCYMAPRQWKVEQNLKSITTATSATTDNDEESGIIPIPEGLFEDGYPLQSIYEPPVTLR